MFFPHGAVRSDSMNQYDYLLKNCPVCGTDLRENNGYQICECCHYWTQKGQARIDPILIC
ncbi:hypothetical protein SAMN06264941_0083 [Methanohalophilus portucalensis FDF-1]|uniref:Viral late gene transcription factor 3 zinc ribbon domain-containing protein n=1 Tax=Methanohalophilus portucalensis FDF-1 TaxID=523843 RepID=A0A1X7MV61_9EURY|nr:hypothetical protein SAMN06264941_0083 [Methanohalophilus portucalensis FDF-1]